MSVAGLQNGDSVTFYRVLKFSQDARTTGGWVADTGFTTLTEEQIRKMLAVELVAGTTDTYRQVAITTENQNQYGIDEGIAADIADMAEVSGVTFKTYTGTAGADGIAKVTGPDEGLYVAIITPARAGDLYNPVFVGVDYQTNTSNIWTVNLNDSYQPASMAKKGEITLEKNATNQTNNSDNKVQTANVGDVITFEVKTTIPEFANSYTNAVFKITDQLTTGLDLDTTSIHVYKGSSAADAVAANELTAADTYSEGKAFKLTTTEGSATTTPVASAAAGDKYEVNFYTQYLLGLGAKQPIYITYTAKVLDTAVTSVNIEDNTVTLNFSNNPTDTEGHGILKDETKHYTFDIDGNLLGEDNWKTTEVIKVGLDKDGKEILQTVNIHEGQTVGALEGAKFKLYVADSNSQTKIRNEEGTEINASVYTNDIYNADTEFVSDATGRITVANATVPGIRGLDAGTYYLVETEAPAGYIKAQNGVKIVINATIENVTHTQYYDSTTGTLYDTQDAGNTRTQITWDVPELKSYTVTMNGVATASYTMTNEKPNKGDNVTGAAPLIGAANETAASPYGKITNTQGVELPSTGGMGTTILYVGGSILVILAAILLITKRRMNAED